MRIDHESDPGAVLPCPNLSWESTLQFRSSGTRLSTAFLAVLAVTSLGAGTLASAPSALAAASVPVSAARSTGLSAFPKDVEITGASADGFFGYSFTSGGERELRWWPYGGGAPTLLDYPEDGGWASSGGDVVALGDDNWIVQMRSLTLRNMADPTAPGVDIDLGALGGNYVAVLGPTSVLAQVTKDDGSAELHIVSKSGTTTTSRKVTGLPADATDFTGSVVRDGAVLVGYETGPAAARTGGRALVDLAAATVSETYASADSGYDFTHLMFSGTQVAWLDWKSGTGMYVTSVDRATGEEKQTVLGARGDEWYTELVGDWLVYGNPWAPVRAVSLTSGETRVLAESGSGSAGAGDGSAVVRGARAADGDGLFRIEAAQDGTPTVTKVADAGEQATGVEIMGGDVPGVAHLDRTGGKVTLGWTLSRPDARLDLTLTHDATGRQLRTRVDAPGTGTDFTYTWDGTIAGVDAPNGAYTVDVRAASLDGLGEIAGQSFAMTVDRTANPHDYTDNGSTDLLARDASGVLWRDDLRDRPVDGQVAPGTRTSRSRPSATSGAPGTATWSPWTVPACCGTTSARGTAPSPPASGSAVDGTSTRGSPAVRTWTATAAPTSSPRTPPECCGSTRARVPPPLPSPPAPGSAAAGASTTRSPPSGTSPARLPGTSSPATRTASCGCTRAMARATSSPACGSAADGTCTRTSSAQGTWTTTGARI
jgi:hypothetical protein